MRSAIYYEFYGYKDLEADDYLVLCFIGMLLGCAEPMGNDNGA